ncbi:hypothetical protein DB30_02853 [Enhygromyxa salina]|uniref:Lipoprotein n=1 Tax=Enhygromyxa salina TaxID=215803 RepID=A0A0C2D871_9BACT|nr:hypothetical protein [Enhygromyxa salina]KIG17820.1 hypothetical protein DB30_02853 [Enhygromyxa salina]
MIERLTTGLALALVLMMGAAHVAGCIERCDDSDSLEPLESGEYMIVNRRGPLMEGYEDLVGAQLIIDRDAETSIIRYTRDGTTYEVRHALDAP